MTKNTSLKYIIYQSIENILKREQKQYASLQEIYQEAATNLQVEDKENLRSQIRGRLQECCHQYKNFRGEALFLTERIKSGKWTINANKKKYIRGKNNDYIISSDNWASIEIRKSLVNEYELEEDLDKVYKIKLMQNIGKEKADIIVEELNRIRKLLKKMKNIDKINDGYGTAFEVFAIATIHNITYEECINKYIIHGDADGKIDAIYYGDEEYAYIYQIKIGNIQDTIYSTMRSNYQDCTMGNIPKDGVDLYHFVKHKREILENKVKEFRSISDNSLEDNNYQPLEIYSLFFEHIILPIKENNLVLHITKPLNKEKQYNVASWQNNFIFYISAKDLIASLVKALGLEYNPEYSTSVDLSLYFTDNVRGELKTNDKMIYTIDHEAKNFVKYNNGINITGEVKDLGDNICILHPVINNGQQTLTTLMNYHKNLDQIILSVKITDELDEDVKGKISQYSNDQVKVRSVDMLSLNPYIRKIQRYIYNNSYQGEKYFLEICSSGKKRYSQLLSLLYKGNHIIQLLDFLKLYFSLENEKDLGTWKNNPNAQIEKTFIDKPFDKIKSFRVCESILRYENYLDSIEDKKSKENFQSSDLAFKYLICQYDLTDEEALKIINNINDEYFYKNNEKGSKLIDIYKSSTIIRRLKEQYKKHMDTKEKSREVFYDHL